jgi:hypothetical protein
MICSVICKASREWCRICMRHKLIVTNTG